MTTNAGGHEPRTTGDKHCPACNKDLPVIMFGTDRHCPDGLRYACRGCTVAKKTNRQRNARWRERRERESNITTVD